MFRDIGVGGLTTLRARFGDPSRVTAGNGLNPSGAGNRCFESCASLRVQVVDRRCPVLGTPASVRSATAGLSWARLAQFDLSYYYSGSCSGKRGKPKRQTQRRRRHGTGERGTRDRAGCESEPMVPEPISTGRSRIGPTELSNTVTAGGAQADCMERRPPEPPAISHPPRRTRGTRQTLARHPHGLHAVRRLAGIHNEPDT